MSITSNKPRASIKGTGIGGSGTGSPGTMITAQVGRHEHGGAEVSEIYPGASQRTRVGGRKRTGLMGSESGMATAEYAIATLAAVGFAGLLVFILRSDEVRGFLMNLIRTALALP
ncbi:DUF4244 domain-containing protein [Pseudarthrobacter sp. N5]|uniref:DUF4244 domain-containing protein n=1 Tax=Pseudarthrobacter sp. N5 TaxID=3418416 RepID=UPI003CE77622